MIDADGPLITLDDRQTVHIADPDNVERKIQAILAAKSTRLQIVADFDFTLTR